MNEDTVTPDKATPPYLSPVTFYNFVESHRRTLPDRIDRSLMSNISGTDQPRILSALRFLGLINAQGYTQPSFQTLRELGEDDLKTSWSGLLKASYPYLFDDFNLAQATQGQIEERFREQGIKGDTVRKGVAFFVSMARTAGIELSPYIKATRLRGSSPGPKETKRRVNAPKPSGAKGTVKTDPPITQGTSVATWRLSNGGVATLSFTGDTFSLPKKERDALYEVADRLKEYDDASPASKAEPAEPGAAESVE